MAAPLLSPEQVYVERRARHAAEHEALTRRWSAIANLRLVVFLGGLALLLWGLAGLGRDRLTWLPLTGGVLLLGWFAVLVTRHRGVGRLRRRAGELRAINDEALSRLRHAWRELPLRHSARAAPDHPYAIDLDIYGHASLAHLLDTSTTPFGKTALSRWLAEPAQPQIVQERQAAVAELARALDLRQELELGARLMGEHPPDPEPFLAWAESEPWLSRQPAVRWTARFSVVLLAALVAAQAAGLMRYPLWLLPLAANVILLQLAGGRAYAALTDVWQQAQTLAAYAELLGLAAAAAVNASALKTLQDALTVDGHAAHEQMRRLSVLASLAIPRSAALYWPIQLVTLWDIHALAALEGWQAASGRRARAWLAALGEVEALAALAALAHDNPEWAFPQIEPGAGLWEARDLGHPLIPATTRVTNPVEIGPAGTFLLVTGSNMSGKSTLLRSIGVNTVLAGAGGPVCASSLRMPPVALWTSMRVQDSLEQGISYFMAELYRLKQVVDAARATGAEQGRTLFYLLDEILQGTNTFERQVAARRIIAFLVARGALGAVSTHDLTLADDPVIAAAALAIHFTETVSDTGTGPTMTFDYRTRPGLATTTNALKLMEIVGFNLGTSRDRSPS